MMNCFSVVVSGAAGQGIETVAGLLASVLKQSGYNVFVTREFMSRIRGGTNSVQLRISSSGAAAFSNQTNLAIPLESGALEHLLKYSRIDKETVVIGEQKVLDEAKDFKSDNIIEISLSDTAKEMGGLIFLNTVAAGVVASFFEVNKTIVERSLNSLFGSKGKDVVDKNLRAYGRGHQIGVDIKTRLNITPQIAASDKIRDQMLLNGAEAVGLGAIAGGCNFLASYPMSPSTGVLTFLSQHAKEFGIVIDQAEDEIAAMNKGIGAWYSGARAMVTTSGGGFALMTEGLSLAGMHESPMVIHLASRPGPATGLPTRTGQEDLNHVLNASHGEFPRIVFTPGKLEDAFYLTQKAFNLADKFQIPVFVLTDQYLMDSSYNIPRVDPVREAVRKQFIKTGTSYKRYEFTQDGISPRGIPGYGEGLIVADSDEHDEAGHITEDLHLRTKMVDKRSKEKLSAIQKVAEPPELVGPQKYKTLVVAWGTNYHVLREAIEALGRSDVAMLHFKQVYPIHESTSKYLKDAERLAIIENNAGAQFRNLIFLKTGYRIEDSFTLLKYSGLPFAVEEITSFLEEVLH
jgi:2-oxoglutarate ferredoxin oxidoreductase subunit alpha